MSECDKTCTVAKANVAASPSRLGSEGKLHGCACGNTTRAAWMPDISNSRSVDPIEGHLEVHEGKEFASAIFLIERKTRWRLGHSLKIAKSEKEKNFRLIALMYARQYTIAKKTKPCPTGDTRSFARMKKLSLRVGIQQISQRSMSVLLPATLDRACGLDMESP